MEEWRMKVRTILATKGMNVITIRPEQSVREATLVLTEHNIGALVVVNEAVQPVGIISERDIIHEAARRQDVFSLSVGQIMTRDVIIGLPQDDLISVAHTMTEKRFRHLPIMERGQLVGVVSIGDIVKCQRDQYQGEIDTLQTQMIADET
jgi:CBS domain-containing protein